MKCPTEALLALFLSVVPAGEAAAGQSKGIGYRSDQLRVLASFELEMASETLSQVQGLRGYDLGDKLDEIGRSPRTVEFIIRCSELLLDRALLESLQHLSVPELFASVHPSLTTKIERLAKLLEESRDVIGTILPPEGRDSLALDVTGAFEQLLATIDDRERPVAERRLLRHSIRGMSAMLCIAGRPSAVDLQSELLDHAIVGYENVLRMIAGIVDAERRARIVAMGLEPVDREQFDRRAEQLAAAREALEEAKGVLPELQLPPDPAFFKGPQD